MMKNGWKKISHNLLFENKFGYKLWKDDVVLSSGKRTVYNYIERKRGYVGIVPVSVDGRIFLLKSWRYALNKYLCEIPLGYMDENETPLQAAKRELKEELGATVRGWVKLGWAWQVPGFIKLKSYFFLALGVTPGKQDVEETEELEMLSASSTEVKTMLDDMVICDSSSIIPLYKALEYLRKRR